MGAYKGYTCIHKMYLSKLCVWAVSSIKLWGERDFIPEGVLVRRAGVHDLNVEGDEELESEIGCKCSSTLRPPYFVRVYTVIPVLPGLNVWETLRKKRACTLSLASSLLLCHRPRNPAVYNRWTGLVDWNGGLAEIVPSGRASVLSPLWFYSSHIKLSLLPCKCTPERKGR